MSRSYTLNPEAARRAEAGRIESTGIYVGTITQAEAIVSPNGAEGIELSFKADDGSTADYITIYTHGKDGKELRGNALLHALMTCMSVRELKPEAGKIKRRINGETVEIAAQLLPALCKRVGLLLQREEYIKRDGSLGFRMVLHMPFDPSTRRVASEILDRKTEATVLDRVAPLLKDRPAQANAGARKGSDSGSGFTPSAAAPATAGFDDDDIPF